MKTSPMATPESVRMAELCSEFWAENPKATAREYKLFYDKIEGENMKTKAQHTATPWEWEVDSEDRLVINAPESRKRICSLLFNTSSLKNIEIEKANAAFIVKACNSHEELLRVCKDISSARYRVLIESGFQKTLEQIIAKAEA